MTCGLLESNSRARQALGTCVYSLGGVAFAIWAFTMAWRSAASAGLSAARRRFSRRCNRFRSWERLPNTPELSQVLLVPLRVERTLAIQALVSVCAEVVAKGLQ